LHSNTANARDQPSDEKAAEGVSRYCPDQSSRQRSIQDPVAVTEQNGPSSKNKKHLQRRAISENDSTHELLVEALREAAELRRKTAIADERVAELLECLE
jgi:hypothetical protein